VNSRDQIASIVAKPAVPSLDHRKIGLGQGSKRGMKLFEYLPGTRTLYIIYMIISKSKNAINTSLGH
jgi:hypothetical protein